MQTAKLISTAISVFAFLPVASTAEDIGPYSCRNGLFPSEQRSLQLGRFAGEKDQKLYFYKDDKGCPNDENRCRTKAYLVPGDELIINKTVGGWACAWFHGKKHETVGWVKTDRLAFLPNEKDDQRNWIGTWKYYSDGGVITIAEKGGSLSVEGSTTWQGGTSTAGYPIVHTGEIKGTIKPVNGRARLSDGDGGLACVVDFVRIGRYLVVHDNGKCGGVNVRFDDVYARTK
jgi:hypothetical protein